MSKKINNIEDYSFDSTISYAESLEVDSLLYSDFEIADVRFSVRTSNCLYRSNIFTLNQLLDCTPEFIRNIRNMGKKSVEEIEDYLMNFINNENSIAKKYEPIRLRQIIENHIDEVYDRNFSFLSEEDVVAKTIYRLQGKNFYRVQGHIFCYFFLKEFKFFLSFFHQFSKK